MHLQHPLKILRRFLRDHLELKEFSTQKGFAALLDCSASLIRAVEQGQTTITPKLVSKIQGATGVSVSWLSTKHKNGAPILGEDGQILTHEIMIERIRKQISENYDIAAKELLVGSAAVLSRSQDSKKSPSQGINRRMASTMGEIVEEALFIDLEKGDTHLMEQLTRLLARQHSSDD